MPYWTSFSSLSRRKDSQTSKIEITLNNSRLHGQEKHVIEINLLWIYKEHMILGGEKNLKTFVERTSPLHTFILELAQVYLFSVHLFHQIPLTLKT
jgi:hypothetical protein